ncbi:MAG: hypothetical protein ACX93U_01195 [Salipiger thiooxidans]
MAYYNEEERRSNLRADPQMNMVTSTRSRGTVTGLLVAVLVIIGLIIGVSFMGSDDAVENPAPATATETVPEAGTTGAAPDAAAPADTTTAPMTDEGAEPAVPAAPAE